MNGVRRSKEILVFPSAYTQKTANAYNRNAVSDIEVTCLPLKNEGEEKPSSCSRKLTLKEKT